MTSTIPNVPRELLERAATSIEQRMCIQCEGVPCCMPESLNTLSDIRALLSAPSSAGVDGWISVSERLPGEDDQVLCWCEDETVAWAEVSSHHNSFFTDMTHELLPVTHWMPLPAAPIKIEANRHDQ